MGYLQKNIHPYTDFQSFKQLPG